MKTNSFNKVIESIIKASGGSPNKVDLNKFIEALNHSFIFTPWNHWLGIRIMKNPLDLMVLQEIIFEKRPDTIIECGTAYGGSAYFMAGLMDLMKIDGKIISIEKETYKPTAFPKKDFIEVDGKVLTVDSNSYRLPVHPRIEYINSDCLTADISKIEGRTMVILDCNHSTNHVDKELDKFGKMVTIGQYLIVEDTDTPDKSKGPAAAVQRFLSRNKNFQVDSSREKYQVSSNLGGYLLRIS